MTQLSSNPLSTLTRRPASRGARWFGSLRVRLALAIVATVTVTMAVSGWLSVRAAEEVLLQELEATATRTAELVAGEVRGMGDPLPISAVEARIRDIDLSAGEVDRIAVIARSGEGVMVLATSGLPPADEGLQLGARAIGDRETRVARNEAILRVAAPFETDRGTAGAVIVRSDVAAVLGLQRRALGSMLWFAAVAIFVLVVVVDLLAKPIVYTPIRQLRETVDRVAEGDLQARAPVSGGDDLADVARGLNQMLEHMEHFNDALQARVREATGEIERRNVERVDAYHRLLAVREQLAGAEQLASIGQTAANVAHQVGTPLNLISGHVQLLREQIGDDPDVSRRLAVIEEQIAKVTTTVRTLLDRSRRLGPRSRTTARELVDRVAEAVRPNLEAAHIRLELEAPAVVTEVLVDPVNLELALLNMVNNAVHAMPAGGRLAIRISTPDPAIVRISIEDTGLGIEPDVLARIFEQWFTTKPAGRGTGLGLSIARDVVQSHGGSISVASEVGRGTTFTIDLPAAGAAGDDTTEP